MARKLPLSKLGMYINSLDIMRRSIFYDKLLNNELMWNHKGDRQYRKKKLDNYRYASVSKPDYFKSILIYISALYADPGLKVEDLFNLHKDYKDLIDDLLKKSLQSNNWKKTI